ncbi:MAG: EAL domain-containing protein [Acidimicrobiales bacterium]|nr:EAL domain-containing protein [Acidimicrobiales bacterium]
MADTPVSGSDDRTRAALAAVRAEAFHVAAAQVSDALLVTVQERPGEHTVAWVNDAFERLTGWPADDILGRSPGCLIGERTDPAVVAHLVGAMADDRPAHERLVLHRRDGTSFVVEAKYVALWSEPVSHLWLLRDVSDVAATEQALRRTEAWARAIIEHSDDVLIVTDDQGRMTYVGQAVGHVLGYDADELTGRDCFELVHPEDLNRVFGDFGDEVRGVAKRTPTELRGRHADGTWRHLSVLATNLLDLPAVQGIVLNCRDISRHRAVSTLLSEQSQVLERVARGMALDDTLASIIELVEGRIPGAQCSIGQLDDAGRVRVTVAPTLPDEVVAALDAVPGTSTLGRSLRAPGPPAVIYDDVATDFRWAGARDVLLEHGLRACWALRLDAPGTGGLLGAIAVYVPEARVPDPDELLLLERVTHLAAIAVERAEFEATLEHEALHDKLTGLPNRSLLLDRIEQALARSRRLGTAVAVLFIDLDDFKVINDSLGHAAGDRLLQQVATRFHRPLRAGDTVGRFGGDEFLLVCEDVEDEAGAVAVATRLAMELEPPFELDDTTVFVRASVGIALAAGGSQLDPTTAADLAHEAESLVRNADAAMYRAKERGRSRYEVFEEDLHRQVVRRLDLERELHQAVAEDQLVVHYQPLIDVRTGVITAVEALVRWERPGHGLVAPAEFIPAAEDIGLIVPLGEAVLERAAHQAVEWTTIAPELTVMVNLSVRQLADERFLERVARVLDESGLPASRLCFEVTESALAAGLGLVDTLRQLCDMSVGFAIDDFGTGYATLDYVRRFPMANHLKIDQSFVAGLDAADSPDRAIISAAIVLGQSLGFTVVAEGVETESQLAILRELDCDVVQGYLFSRPVPADEIAALLVDPRPWL